MAPGQFDNMGHLNGLKILYYLSFVKPVEKNTLDYTWGKNHPAQGVSCHDSLDFI